jgi:hypothetical protein
MTEQSDVKAAAKRLIAEAAIAEREMLHMYNSSHRPDYLTVAHAALEAVNDLARLLGEVEALKVEAALQANALHALVCNAYGYDKSIVRALALWARGSKDERYRDLIERVLDAEMAAGRVSHCSDFHADDAAPAMAPGASDAEDGSD